LARQVIEIWRPIEKLDFRYEISTFGRLRNVRTNKILKVCSNGNKSVGTVICFNGKRIHISIPRLVAEAFLPNQDNKDSVKHIDGDHLNNSVFNLKWENKADIARENSLKRKKSSKTISKSTYNKQRALESKRKLIHDIYAQYGMVIK